MSRQHRERFAATLALLLTLAAGGAFIGGLSGGLLVPVATVLVLAYAKGRLVVLDFMELRESAGPMRIALLAWPALMLSLALARIVATTLFV
ncbi:cytochrome C oxidase subunit IV family protein [Rhizobium sp. YJ-22]|uniref:cytochrome C oxidase subunit IV family protein n=1 Tax=Rhizobium sp. YJ-22 TaxID=3037556 RepID=UPI0024122A1C|nr:cytochrome C oxidase subunit IV family protein [Rhizobium sp. YJ-22]MDG3579951.1 cytochrome C oxidase subunit IV family protein [Rhizobium sp. YJ-22]